MTNEVRPPDAGLDAVDRRLLTELVRDGRLANNRLADRLGVAASTAHARTRQLLQRGIIRGVHADVDLSAVGRPVEALVAVRLRAHDRAQIEAFSRRVPALPEVIQTFHVSGAEDYVLHVAVPSSGTLRDWVLDHLTTDPTVAHTETTLVFEHRRGNAGPLR